MKSGEFIVLMGRTLFYIEDLDYFDEIISSEVHRFEDSVRRGWIEVFQRRPSDDKQYDNFLSLGRFNIDIIKHKFT